tara:strand:- start:1703 stop:1912 length:210 start_codon:yes stop_codon:yes gene_type:complete
MNDRTALDNLKYFFSQSPPSPKMQESLDRLESLVVATEEQELYTLVEVGDEVMIRKWLPDAPWTDKESS